MDSKNFLVNFIKERIFTNNSRLVTAAATQEALLRVVDNVYQARDYSTTEQLTGGKWVDGLPIYRRTVYLPIVADATGAYTSAQANLLSSLLMGDYFCIESAMICVGIPSPDLSPMHDAIYVGLGSSKVSVEANKPYADFGSPNYGRIAYITAYVTEPSYQIMSASVVVAYTKQQPINPVVSGGVTMPD